MNELTSANEFEAATHADWLKSAQKALGGASFDTLRTPLYEGFQTEPLYPATSVANALFSAQSPRVIHHVNEDSAADALDAVEVAFEGGANAVLFDLRAPTASWLETRVDLKAMMEPFATHKATVYAICDTADAAFLLSALDRAQSGTAGLDPITTWAETGLMPADVPSALDDSIDAAVFIQKEFTNLVPFAVSDRAWHGAGGSAVEELAFTLSSAVAYWRAVALSRLDLAEAQKLVSFRLTALSDLFLTIAKFRSLRLLWQRATEAARQPSGVTTTTIIAETSPRVLTAYDRHVNLLRGTAGAFGAILGGADAVMVRNFDEATTKPSASSTRLARNTMLVLTHEARLATVADAGAGSGAIEGLTDALCERAWTLFCEVQARGGMVAALEDGFVSSRLHDVHGRREAQIASRRDKITGVSVFANLDEPALASQSMGFDRPTIDVSAEPLELPRPCDGVRFKAMIDAASAGVTRSRLKAANRVPMAVLLHPITRGSRDAEPFERLRRQSDNAVSQLGSRPPVFVAVLGDKARCAARLSWTAGFFRRWRHRCNHFRARLRHGGRRRQRVQTEPVPHCLPMWNGAVVRDACGYCVSAESSGGVVHLRVRATIDSVTTPSWRCGRD